jgi:hypothetical protein
VQRSRLGALLAALLAPPACTARQTTYSTSTIDRTQTRTITPSAAGTGPLDVRPTAVADAHNCPLLEEQAAADMLGMRLARIEVLRQGGTTIGCRFYALQGSPLATSEHLPGPNQPVVQITSSAFADTHAAYYALARLADAGTDQAQYPIRVGIIGVAFRTGLDPSDGAKDWAVAFNKSSTLVVVKTAVIDTSADALAIARSVAAKF